MDTAMDCLPIKRATYNALLAALSIVCFGMLSPKSPHGYAAG